MIQLDYTVGKSYALVGDQIVLFVGATAAEKLSRLWDLIKTHHDVTDVVDLLSEEGISAMPDFSCVSWADDSVRVLVRGSIQVEARISGADDQWSGTGVSTWVERRLTSASSVLLGLVGEMPGLPISNGVVLAAGLRVILGPEDPASAVEPCEPVSQSQLSSIPLAAVEVLPETAPELHSESAEAAAAGSATELSLGPELTDPMETKIEPVDDSFDAWFGRTVARSPEDAAVRDEDGPQPGPMPSLAPAPAEPEPADGDHDGHTIAGRSRAKLIAGREASVIEPASGGRKTSATLTFSTGEVVPVADLVYVGRAPQARLATEAGLPRLVTVPSPSSDISRTHLEIRLEGTDLLATDVSTNGTILTRKGQPAERIPGRQQILLNDGAELDLGDGIVISVAIEKLV